MMVDSIRLIAVVSVFLCFDICYADDLLGDLESSLLGDEDDGKSKGGASASKKSNCPSFKDLPNVNRFSNETEAQSVVLFECKTGYERASGSTTRVCQQSLKWSGTDLVCKRVHCPKLTIPLAKPNDTNTMYGTSVAIFCKKGYIQVYGDVIRTCHANKTWSGKDIRCLSNTCTMPKMRNGVVCNKATGSKIPVGEAITCSCQSATHTIIRGNRNRTCVKMEKWSGTGLECGHLQGFKVEVAAKMKNCSGFCHLGCGDKILVPGGDVNGDGYADLICHKQSGHIHIALNDKQGGFLCQKDPAEGVEDGWCRHEELDYVLAADFDGDKRVDLMCHNYRTGHKDIRLRNKTGNTYWNPGNDDFPKWCIGMHAEFHVADFDGDGKADLFCHHNVSGTKWFLKGRMPSLPYKVGQTKANGWCTVKYPGHMKLYVGDSNGDGSTDIYCHDDLGRVWIAETEKIDNRSNTAWQARLSSKADTGAQEFSKFCPNSSKARMNKFHLMDFDGDGTDDLYCHRTTSAEKNCVALGKAGKFPSEKCVWESKEDYCNQQEDLLIFDKYFGSKKDDILCIRKGKFLLIRNNGP